MQFRCPTCRATWRQTTLCSRCGTDLTTLMQVVHRAWELREAARQFICAGTQPAEAVRLARAACQLHATPQARQLLALAFWANHQMAEAHAVTMSLLTEQEATHREETPTTE
jgi:predicted amidophosphoribosyltransferase